MVRNFYQGSVTHAQPSQIFLPFNIHLILFLYFYFRKKAVELRTNCIEKLASTYQGYNWKFKKKINCRGELQN